MGKQLYLWIYVDNSQKKLYCRREDDPANRLYLNELFSMYTTFSDKKFRVVGYVPFYDIVQCYKNRTELINAVFGSSDLEYVNGNLNAVSEYINEKQKKLVYCKNGG